jgi:hypothetical protein
MGQTSLTGYSFLVPALILWSHRQNIRRLINGTEPRIGDPKPKPAPGPKPSDPGTPTDAASPEGI